MPRKPRRPRKPDPSLFEQDPVAAAVRRAVRWLESADRTRAELLERLTRAGFAPRVAAEAIERLGSLVSDARAAESIAHRITRAGPASRRLLRDSIEARGIDPRIAERVARDRTPSGDRAAAREAAARAAERLPPSLKPDARWRRVLSALGRAGFEEELARDAAESVLGPPPDAWD